MHVYKDYKVLEIRIMNPPIFSGAAVTLIINRSEEKIWQGDSFSVKRSLSNRGYCIEGHV